MHLQALRFCVAICYAERKIDLHTIVYVSKLVGLSHTITACVNVSCDDPRRTESAQRCYQFSNSIQPILPLHAERGSQPVFKKIHLLLQFRLQRVFEQNYQALHFEF